MSEMLLFLYQDSKHLDDVSSLHSSSDGESHKLLFFFFLAPAAGIFPYNLFQQPQCGHTADVGHELWFAVFQLIFKGVLARSSRAQPHGKSRKTFLYRAECCMST